MKFLLCLFFLFISTAHATLVTLLPIDNPDYFKVLNFELNKSNLKDVEKVYAKIPLQHADQKKFVCLTDGKFELELVMQGEENIVTDFILQNKTTRDCFPSRDVLRVKIYDFVPGALSADVTKKWGPAFQFKNDKIVYDRVEPFQVKDERHTYLEFELENKKIVKSIRLYRLIGRNP
jgi:hypothetical protein